MKRAFLHRELLLSLCHLPIEGARWKRRTLFVCFSFLDSLGDTLRPQAQHVKLATLLFYIILEEFQRESKALTVSALISSFLSVVINEVSASWPCNCSHCVFVVIFSVLVSHLT